jgi:TrmH family RNA methyltransferase
MLSKNEIKYIQSLKAKKQRREMGVFVVEGSKSILELLSNNRYVPEIVYGTESFFAQTPEGLVSHVPHKIISEEDLQSISFLQTPQHSLALVKMVDHPFEPFAKNTWSLMLDSLQDPGNLGTIIRIADWFGIENIYASEDTAEVYNPKVVQASMGSIFRTKVMYGNCEQWLTKYKPNCYVATMQGQSVWSLPVMLPGVIVIGNEGRGVSATISALATQHISIPKLGYAESLNAGVAAGIILSHLLQTQ